MKKTIGTITLAVVMTFGATFANAGILVADRAARPCEEATATTGKKGIIVFGRSIGIIVFGAAAYMNTGIIVFGEKDSSCADATEKSPGIIVFG